MATLGVTALGLSASIGLIVKSAAEYQTEIVKSARASQESTKEFSKLNYIAEITGISVEDLSDDLDDLVETFDKIDDPTKQAQAAFDAFGAEGLRLVPILKEGEQGIEAFKEEAQAMGLVVSEQAGANAQLFDESLKKITQSLKGLTSTISESIIEFVNQSGVLESVKNVIIGITTWWRNLSDGVKDAIVKAVLFVSSMGAVLAAVSAVVTIISLLVASLSLVTVVIGAALTIIGALAFAIIDNWNTIKSSILPSVEYFKQQIGKIVDDFKEFVNSLSDDSVFKGIAEEFLNIGNSAEEAGVEISIMGTAANIAVKVIATGLVSIVDGFEIIKRVIQDSVKQWALLGQVVQASFSFDFEEAGFRLDELRAHVASTQQDMTDKFEKFKNRIGDIWSGDILVAARKGVKKDLDVIGEDVKETTEDVKQKFASFKDIKLDELRVAILGVSKAWTQTANGSTVAIDSINEQITLMQKKIDDSTKGIKPISLAEKLELQVKINVLEEEKSTAKLNAFVDLVEKSAKKLQVITKPFSDLSDIIAEDIKRAADIEDRNMEVIINRKQEEYDALVEATEAGEQARIDAIDKSFQDEIDALKAQENSKNNIVENAANERLLLLDEEFRKAKEAKEAEFQSYIESETAKFEFDKEMMLQKALDKEQRQLAEAILDNDFNQFILNQQTQHEQQMDLLTKEFAQRKKETETRSKDESIATKNALKQKIEDLQKQQDLSVTSAEEAKDNKLRELEKAHNAEMAVLDKQRTQKQWEAEVAALEATKATKVAEVIATGIASAAQIFAIMAASLPFGLGIPIGAALAAMIIGVTTAKAAQVASQTVVKPAALMAEGGVIGGNTTHAMGGVRAELESGEAVISANRTDKLMNWIDQQTGGTGGGITINIQPGAITTGDSLIDEKTLDKFSYLISQRLERYGIR